jgi:Spy/CpxP family protein refolding chaperone
MRKKEFRMTRRFVTLVTLAAMLLAGTFAFAGKSGGSGGGGGKSGGKSGGKQQSDQSDQSAKKGSSSRVDADLDSLAKQLNLTDEQKAKIKPILQDQAKKLKDLKKDSSIAKADRKAKSSEIKQDSLKQIRPILTADQQKKLDEMPKSEHKGGKHSDKQQAE